MSCRRTGHNALSDRRETHEGRHADGRNAAPTTPRIRQMVCGYRSDLVHHPGSLIFRESLSADAHCSPALCCSLGFLPPCFMYEALRSRGVVALPRLALDRPYLG